VLDDELRELYQDVILDHQQDPRNFGPMQHPTHHAEGFNPLCGDRIRLELDMDGDRIRQVSFTGAGCAISTASASMMTEALTGKTRAEAEAVSQDFRDLVTGRLRDTEDGETAETSRLGKLYVLAGVQQFPVRVKCATLAWHTLAAALNEEKPEPVTTE
jgi:nitrogen fixation protein NifU and related proteins